MYSQLRLVIPNTVCNLACKYCMSGYSTYSVCAAEGRFDSEKILKTIGGKRFDSISIWGGEPFANYEKLQQTVEFCRNHFPDKQVGFITNGYLLNEEKVEYLNQNNIIITISHDGYGQHYRSARDFLQEDSYIYLLRNLKINIAFNSVIHRYNCNISRLFNYFEKVQDKLDRPIAWNFEIFKLYDAAFAEYIISGNAICELSRSLDFLYEQFAKGHVFAYTAQASRLKSLASTIDNGVSVGCQCGANNRLSIRTNGQLAFCQVAAELGNYNNVTVELPTMCNDCEYAKYCRGICPLLTDGYRKKICIAHKLYFLKTFQFFNLLLPGGDTVANKKHCFQSSW